MARTPSLVIDAEAGTIPRPEPSRNEAATRLSLRLALPLLAALLAGGYAIWLLAVHGWRLALTGYAWMTRTTLTRLDAFEVEQFIPGEGSSSILENQGTSLNLEWHFLGYTSSLGVGSGSYSAPFAQTLATVLLALGLLAVSAFAMLLVARLRRDMPFSPSLAKRIARLGGALIGAAALSIALLVYAWLRLQALVDALEGTGRFHVNGVTEVVTAAPTALPVPDLSGAIFIGAAGVVMVLLAQSFAVGERLRRDTEGLV